MSNIIIKNRAPEEMDLADPGTVWVYTEGPHCYPSSLYWMSNNNGWQEYNGHLTYKPKMEPEDILRRLEYLEDRVAQIGVCTCKSNAFCFNFPKASQCVCSCKK